MKRVYLQAAVTIIVVMLTCLMITHTEAQVAGSPMRVCYYSTWAADWKTPAGIALHQLDPYLCTHIIIAFVKVNTSYAIDYTNAEQSEMFRNISVLKKKNPALKLSVSVGGWFHGSPAFVHMARTADRRQKFIKSWIEFSRRHGIDGLNIDWEYPYRNIKLYSELLMDLRKYVQTTNATFLITAAVTGLTKNAPTYYNYAVLASALDYILITAYDFHGHQDFKTGHHSALWRDPINRTVTSSVMHYVERGIPRNKIVVGIPLFGRVFTTAVSNAKPGDDAIGATAGYYTLSSGYLAYFEVCAFYLARGATYAWDAEAGASYCYKGNTWISYDSKQAICHKLKWVQTNGLKGWMVWTMERDDHTNFCRKGCNPILRFMTEMSAKNLTSEDCDNENLRFN